MELDGVRVGLTVCYDLRFPELYRTLTLEGGASVLTVPSNFTLHTGMAHWEVLLRARAIENQAFVLATGQHGVPGGLDKPSYGHSMIVDPWGTVLAQAPDGDGVISADLDLDRLAAVRRVAARARAPPAGRLPAAGAGRLVLGGGGVRVGQDALADEPVAHRVQVRLGLLDMHHVRRLLDHHQLASPRPRGGSPPTWATVQVRS